VAYFTPDNPNKPGIHGGFAMAQYCDTPDNEAKLKKLKVTVRCIPLAGEKTPGRCILSGAPSPQRVLLAKSY
jgi:prolyl-tRNA synthetase